MSRAQAPALGSLEFSACPGWEGKGKWRMWIYLPKEMMWGGVGETLTCGFLLTFLSSINPQSGLPPLPPCTDQCRQLRALLSTGSSSGTQPRSGCSLSLCGEDGRALALLTRGSLGIWNETQRTSKLEGVLGIHHLFQLPYSLDESQRGQGTRPKPHS